jgi:hypothetical protein
MCIGAIQGGFFNLKISLPAAVGLGVAGNIYTSHITHITIYVFSYYYMCVPSVVYVSSYFAAY